MSWNDDQITRAGFVTPVEAIKVTHGWTGHRFDPFFDRDLPSGSKKELELAVNCILPFRTTEWSCEYKLDKSRLEYEKAHQKRRERGGVVINTSINLRLRYDQNNYWLDGGHQAALYPAE